MLFPAKTRKGFTLVELLIVVGIVALITGGLIPAFSNYMQNQDLLQAQEQLKNDLRSIQNRALAGAQSETLVGGNQVHYWGVQFVSGSADFTYFISDVNTSCPPANRQVEGEYKVPHGLVLNASSFTSPPNGCIFFSFSDGGSSRSQLRNNIILGKPGDTECRRLVVNSAGLIRSISGDSNSSCSL